MNKTTNQIRETIAMSKRIISIYYIDSNSTPVILNDGTKEYVNKKRLNFYGLESEIDNRATSLINKDSSVVVSHAHIH
jgi:hypothetical protein